MLKALHIENFAIMKNLEVEFQAGLNVLTGETGSGKSIVVDAISMLMGEPASTLKIRRGSEKAVVEGLFEIDPGSQELREKITGMGLDDPRGDLIIRRDIYASGTGRCYINGRMSNSSSLSGIGAYLCDIHGQHQHQALLRESSQLDMLDEFSGADDLRREVGRLYGEMKELEERLALLRESSEERRKKTGDLRYAIDEIERACLERGEEETLDNEIRIARNLEALHSLFGRIMGRLCREDGSVVESLGLSLKEMEEARHIDSRLSEEVEITEGCYFQLEELTGRLRGYMDGLVYDANRHEELVGRKALIQDLKKKYGSDIDDILEFHERATRELGSMEEESVGVEELSARHREAGISLHESARKLTGLRRVGAERMEREVLRGLEDLGMDKASFKICFTHADGGETGRTGAEGVSFLISTNPGEDVRPLSDVVSGGELSRIMLVLRALQASKDRVLTLVFDEVDTGIGGNVAHAVGDRLLDVSRDRQVFVITHLPQIAARARHHYSVRKSSAGGRPEVRIAELDADGRVEEIVRMLGGKIESDASR